MRHHDYLWFTSIDDRCDPLGALEDLADTLAHLGNDLLWCHPALVRIVTLAFDHEAMMRVEQFVPADAPDLRAKHLWRLGRHFLDDPQDAARRAQLQVQLVKKSVACLEAYSAVAGYDAARTQ